MISSGSLSDFELDFDVVASVFDEEKIDGEFRKEIECATKIIARGSVDIVQRKELIRKLIKSKLEGRPLSIKVGIDPTSPDLHLGHVVLFQKMRQFQDLGHQVIFLIGDFTAMIGDPSGRSEIRKPLTREAVKKNAETYKEQAFKILSPERTTIRFNSEWMDRMTSEELIQLASHYTVARILERDDFQKRYHASMPIGVHEFLYPLIQGYDSVALNADLEFGGTDQTFNLLVGRVLQKIYGQMPQVVLTMPLLEGTDGQRKMSKSFGNHIALKETPFSMYGKIMSIYDDLMYRYYELLTDHSLPEIKKRHPMEAKMDLAFFLVERFYDQKSAFVARDQFDVTVGRKTTTDVPFELRINSKAIRLLDLMVEQNWATSKGNARRLIRQGAVELNGKKILDPAFEITIEKGKRHNLKIGKKIKFDLI